MRFILWDATKGDVPRGEGGSYLTSGAVGCVDVNNSYLTLYAMYPDARRPHQLALHERIRNVKYSMSWTHGVYDIIRVE